MAETTQSAAAATSLRASGDASAPAERALSDAKSIGSELLAAVGDSATALYEEQRDRAADEIAAIGDVLRRSVQSLDQPGGVAARYGDETARQLSEFAELLRHRSWSELTGDIEDFARRYPVGFVGAAAGLGFVAGRFLAVSARPLMAKQKATSSRRAERGAAGGIDASAEVTSAVSGGAGG